MDKNKKHNRGRDTALAALASIVTAIAFPRGTTLGFIFEIASFIFGIIALVMLVKWVRGN